MIRYLVLFTWILLAIPQLSAQGALIWEKSLGGSSIDQVYKVTPAGSNTFLMVGSSYSQDGDFYPNNGLSDAYFCLTTNQGEILWLNQFGGSQDESILDVCPHPQGGWMLAGYTYSNDKDLPPHENAEQGLLIRIDANGEILWSKLYGGEEDDRFNSIGNHPSGGFILSGYVDNEERSILHGDQDYWILHLDDQGEVLWESAYGGSNFEEIIDHTVDNAGNIYCAGYSWSSDEDISAPKGLQDVWLVKLNSSGQLTEERSIGGTFNEAPHSILLDPNETIWLAGSSLSDNGDFDDNFGFSDAFLIELNTDLDLLSSYHYGAENNEWFNEIKWYNDGIAFCGFSKSIEIDGNTTKGESDYWIGKISIEGELLWSEIYGGSNEDVCRSFVLSEEGAFLMAGVSSSEDGDISQPLGFTDIWLASRDISTSLSEVPFPHNEIPWTYRFSSGSQALYLMGIPSGKYKWEIFDIQGYIWERGLINQVEGNEIQIPVSSDLGTSIMFFQLRNIKNPSLNFSGKFFNP